MYDMLGKFISLDGLDVFLHAIFCNGYFCAGITK
jgi:hypothetical protein